MSACVYLSYGRDEAPSFVDELLEWAKRLRSDGVDVRVDQYEVAPPQGWARWISEQVRTAEFVLVACTPSYCARFQDASKDGRSEQWEASLLHGLLFDRPEFRARTVPILLDGHGDDCVPELLRDTPAYRLPAQYIDLVRRLTNQPARLRPPLGPGRVEVTNLGGIPRSSCFVGRLTELDQLHESLGSAAEATGPACVALVALGGTGKSRLALEYAHAHAGDYDVRWWIRAASTLGMDQDLVALGRELGLAGANDEHEHARQKTLEWLASHDRWLLVFDDATDAGDVRTFVPSLGRGAVLVTTRARGWRGFATTMELEQLAPEDALELLVGRSGTDDDGAGEALCRKLGCLALALTQAAAYIDAVRCSFSEYHDMFREVGVEVFRPARASTGDPDASTVHKTWQLSIERVAASDPDAVLLLRFLAFLDPDGVSTSLLSEHCASLPPRLAARFGSAWARSELLAELLAYSLVDRHDDTIRVHRLVQAVVRASLGQDAVIEIAEQVIDWIEAVFAYSPEVTRVADVPSGIAKQLVVACTLNEGIAAGLGRTVRLLSHAGIYYLRAGVVRGARTICEASVKIADDLVARFPVELGLEHQLCGALEKFVEVETRMGNLVAARELQLRALTVAEELVRREDDEATRHMLALCMLKYGQLESFAGRTEHALAMHRGALSIMGRLAATDELEPIARRHHGVTLQQVADAELRAGNDAEAHTLLRRALEIFESLTEAEPENPQLRADISGVLTGLGMVELGRCELDSALSLLRRSADIADELVDTDPHNVARQQDLFVSLSRLGQLEIEAGGYATASELFARAWDIAAWCVELDPHDASARFNLVLAYGSYVQLAGRVRDSASFNANLGAMRELFAAMDADGQLRGFRDRESYQAFIENLARRLEDAGGWNE